MSFILEVHPPVTEMNAKINPTSMATDFFLFLSFMSLCNQILYNNVIPFYTIHVSCFKC